MSSRRARVVANAVVLCLLALPLSMVLTSCAQVRTCFPAKLAVSSDAVSRGDVVTLSSPAAHCDLGYGAVREYSVRLGAGHVSTPAVLVHVARDGSFSTDFRVPRSFPAGPAEFFVIGSPYDDCDDTGGSCAGYGVPVQIQP